MHQARPVQPGRGRDRAGRPVPRVDVRHHQLDPRRGQRVDQRPGGLAGQPAALPGVPTTQATSATRPRSVTVAWT
ncbi:hypothetical protein GCM10025734_49440 [Kitasatospora paranensis]